MKKFISALIIAITAISCVFSVSAEVYADFSVNDITNIQKWIVGLTAEIDEDFADANGDGTIDVRDVTYRQKELAKIPPYYTEPTTTPEIPDINDDSEDIFGEN